MSELTPKKREAPHQIPTLFNTPHFMSLFIGTVVTLRCTVLRCNYIQFEENQAVIKETVGKTDFKFTRNQGRLAKSQ
jgi:hypothetical protein